MDCNVRNANYERVVAVMDKFLKERYRNVCSCPRCVNDIAAIALNYLPPHYYVEKAEERGRLSLGNGRDRRGRGDRPGHGEPQPSRKRPLPDSPVLLS